MSFAFSTYPWFNVSSGCHLDPEGPKPTSFGMNAASHRNGVIRPPPLPKQTNKQEGQKNNKKDRERIEADWLPLTPRKGGGDGPPYFEKRSSLTSFFFFLFYIYIHTHTHRNLLNMNPHRSLMSTILSPRPLKFTPNAVPKIEGHRQSMAMFLLDSF